MNTGVSQPHLRLVGLHATSGYAEWEQRQRSRNAVVKENRLSAHGPLIDPADPVLKLAAEARGELQGAVLTPERRERLLKLANRIGVRPFDASLVIAIEQDRARSSKGVSDLPPCAETPAPGSTVISSRVEVHVRWMLATVAAALLAIACIRLLGLN